MLNVSKFLSPRPSVASYFQQHLFHLVCSIVPLFHCSEMKIRHSNAFPNILGIRIRGIHLALFIFQESFIRNMVGFGICAGDPSVTDLRIGIHRQEVKLAFGSKGIAPLPVSGCFR